MTVREAIEVLGEMSQDAELMLAESSRLSNLHPVRLVKETFAIRYDDNLSLGTDDVTGVEKSVRLVIVMA